MSQTEQKTNCYTWATWAIIDGRVESKMMINFQDVPTKELKKIRDTILSELDSRLGRAVNAEHVVACDEPMKKDYPR